MVTDFFARYINKIIFLALELMESSTEDIQKSKKSISFSSRICLIGIPAAADWTNHLIASGLHANRLTIAFFISRLVFSKTPTSSDFTTEFSKNYSDFLKQNDITDIRMMRNDSIFQQKLRDFSLSQYLKHKENGHYSNIQKFFKNAFNLFPDFFNSSSSSSDEVYHALASSYISDVLFHFTEFDERDGIARFQYVAYFTKVYIFNCDIWGTAFCYSVFFSFSDQYKYDEYIGVDPNAYSHFLRFILSMYMNQIMINGHKKINISKLAKAIQELV